MNAALALTLAIVMRPWSHGWGTPVNYGEDTLAHAAIVSSVGITGTAGHNTALGSPYGLSWADFPLGGDRLHLIMLRLLRAITSDPVRALAIYGLLGFFLIATASMLTLRALGVRSPLVAGGTSILFALLPYHFARLESGHYFLAAYYAVPLGVLLAVWTATGGIPGVHDLRDPSESRRTSARRLAIVAVLVIVVGSASVYYAAFAVVGIVSLGIVVAVRRWSWRALTAPLVTAAAVGAIVLANIAGDLLSARALGWNTEVSYRSPEQSDAWGLRLAQMILPMPEHRMSALGELGRIARRVAQPGEAGAALGLLALAGLVLVFAYTVRRTGRTPVPSDTAAIRSMPYLAVIAVSLILIGLASGGSMVLGALGFVQIRGWSRVSVVVGFVGLAGLAIVLDRLLAAPPSAGRAVGAAVAGVLLVGVWDQTNPGALPRRVDQARAVASDRTAGEDINRVSPGGRVFELPIVSFVEGTPVGALPPYALLGPAESATTGLQWSFGGMRGREADWQLSLSERVVAEQAVVAAASDFQVLMMDRRGYPDGGSDGEQQLNELLGAPAGSSLDGTKIWYDLRGLRALLQSRIGRSSVEELGSMAIRPIGVTYEGAIDRWARGDRHRLVKERSAIRLRRYDDDGSDVSVRFTVRGHPGAHVAVTVAGRRTELTLGGSDAAVEIDVPMQARSTKLEVETDAPRLADAGPAFGDVRLELSNMTVADLAFPAALETAMHAVAKHPPRDVH
jgi:phosphoglycerol transferase